MIADLTAELFNLEVVLSIDSSGGLAIDGPEDAFDDVLVGRLSLHRDDLLELLIERAAIMEYDGGVIRDDAESLASLDVSRRVF